MSDEDALLAAIVANPDDDTPRLVYADWLDENGYHERAEFIRASQGMAAMPSRGTKFGKAVVARMPRVRELLDAKTGRVCGPGTILAAQMHHHTEKEGPFWDCGWLHTAALGMRHKIGDNWVFSSCHNVERTFMLAAEQPFVRRLWVNYDQKFIHTDALEAAYNGGMTLVRSVHIRCGAMRNSGPWPPMPVPLLVTQLARFQHLREVHAQRSLARMIQYEIRRLRDQAWSDRVTIFSRTNYR